MDEVTFDELEQRLAYIGRSAVSVCRTATRNGAKVHAAAQAAAAPVAKHGRRVNGVWVNPGGMRRSIGFGGLRAKNGLVGAKAGLDVRKKNPEAGRGSHGHLYVEGTDYRYTGFRRVRVRGKLADMKRNQNKIRFTGKSPPNLPSFIVLASQSADAEAVAVVVRSIITGIERAATRQGL